MSLLLIIYLLLSGVLLINTVGAFYPRVYGEVLAPAGAVSTLVLVLFWPLFLVLGLWLTGVVAYYGGLHHPVGQLAFLVHLVSWGLLFYYQLKTYQALPVLDGQPVADQDQPFCAGLTEEERRLLRAGQVSLRPSLTLKIAAMAEAQRVATVVFREVDGVRLRLDVYRPRHAKGKLPTAVYIHGGGWVLGTRRQSRFMCYELAAAGWVVFAVSYRFAPRFPMPAAIHDCKAALAWVHEHGHEYGAQTDDLVVMGGSAGGHLSAMMALTVGDPRFQPGFPQGDTRVSGAVVLYGVSDFETVFTQTPHRVWVRYLEDIVFRARYSEDPSIFRLVQPTSHVAAEVPPILLVHGQNDGLVPPWQSRRLHDALRTRGAQSVHLLEIPYGLHAFEIMPTPLHQRAVRVIVRFMEALRRRPQVGSSSHTG